LVKSRSEKSIIFLKAHEFDLKVTSSPSETNYTLVTLTTRYGEGGSFIVTEVVREGPS
jgi:hypothetical protein